MRATVISPARGWPAIDLAELWRYRELLYFLVWRDVKVRYAQTVLGAAWAVLQPVLATVIFTVIFGRFAGIPSDGAPYSLFALSALVAWTYFSSAFGAAGNSLVENSRLITKVYFPRVLVPLTPVFAGLVDLAIAGMILLVLLAWFGIMPGQAVLLIPVLVLVMMASAAGVGFWLAALNVQYRDVRYAIPFLGQLWMFASPVVYPMSVVPERYQPIYALNPMAGVIEGFRTAFLGTGGVALSLVVVSSFSALVLFASGLIYFLRLEERFADIA